MKKQSLIIFILIILLTGTMLLGYFFQSSKRADRQQSASVLQNIGAGINTKDIGVVQINDLRLEYESNSEYWEGWVYKDDEKNLILPVSSKKMKDFLENLQSFSQGRLVETEPSELEKYNLAELDDKEKMPYRVFLESKAGKKVFSFVLSQSTNPTYARFQNDKAVYKVASTLHSALSSNNLYWLDTRIFPDKSSTDKVPLDEIKSITIRLQEGRKLLLTKEIDEGQKKNKKAKGAVKWKLADSSVMLDSSKISRYIRSFFEAKAKDFSDVEVTDSMKNSEVIIRLKDESEYAVVLYSFADNFYVKRKSKYTQYTFLITKYLKDTLFPSSEEVFIAEPQEEEKEVSK